jgi:hypothetical protein
MSQQSSVQQVLAEKRPQHGTTYAIAPIALSTATTQLLSSHGGAAVPGTALTAGPATGAPLQSAYVNQVLFMAPAKTVATNAAQCAAAR